MTIDEAEELIEAIVRFHTLRDVEYLALRDKGYRIELHGHFTADQLTQIAQVMEDVE